MLNTRKLLRLIQHDLAIQVPDDQWKALYQRLSQLVAPIGHSRYTIMLVKLKPYYGNITIENGFHEPVVTIPKSLDNLKRVTFAPSFYHLPDQLQQAITAAIQATIDRASQQRKKDEWDHQANQISFCCHVSCCFFRCS